MIILAFLATYVAAVAGTLVAAARDLRSGERAADRAAAEAGVETVTEGRGVADLADARRRFGRGAGRLDSPVLAPVRVLPVAGRHLASARALAHAGEDAAATGERALSDARAAVERASGDATARVGAVRELEQIASRAERDLARIDLGPERALAGPVRDQRARFAAELGDLRRAARHGREAAAVVHRLLAGPQRYLVLAANNAEMRAGSGMFLSVGVVESVNGSLRLLEMTPAGEAKVDPPVPVSGELQDLWGFVGLGGDWRMLAMSPRFDVTASLAADMWRARTGQGVDGVLALDVVALRAVVEATGPVTVAGRELEADGLTRFVLRDQYAELGARFNDRQTERRDALAELARSALERLGGGGLDAGVLGRGLVAAARGRHVLAWSPDPAEQRGWAAAGVAGGLDDSSLLLSLVNRGGNKLDQFLRVESSLAVEAEAATVDVVVRNASPASGPAYVLGPNPDVPGAEAGAWIGLVSLTVPGWVTATSVETPDACPVVRTGPDGPTRVIACQLVLARGAKATISFRLGLPDSSRSVRIEPSARVPATTWQAGGRSFRDTRPRRVGLSDG